MAVPVFAQSPKLKGITAVQLIAEDMDETDSACGLTDAAFKSAVAEPILNGKIRRRARRSGGCLPVCSNQFPVLRLHRRVCDVVGS